MATAVFVQQGASIDYTPGSDVAAGDVVVSGELVGVATWDIAAGETGGLAVEGVFDFPKATGASTAIPFGNNVYWDVGTQEAQEDDEVGANKLIGKTVAAAGDSAPNEDPYIAALWSLDPLHALFGVGGAFELIGISPGQGFFFVARGVNGIGNNYATLSEENVPALLWKGNNAASLINVFEAEVGIAFHAGETATAAVITQNGGLVDLGEGITTAKYVKTDGDFRANGATLNGPILAL